MGTNLIADVLSGFTPPSLPVLLVCLVSPIIVFVAWVLGRQADAVARRHNAQTDGVLTGEPAAKVKSGKGT